MTAHQRTLQSELLSRLDSAPDSNAFTLIDSRARFQWRTFSDVFESAATCAEVLSSNGLKPSDACVLVVPSDEHACHAVLACLLLGALPVLIAPPVVRGVHSNLSDVIKYVARKVSARMIVVGDEAVEVGEELKSSSISIVRGPDDWIDEKGQLPQASALKATDIACYQLTSGTTGFPKICVWAHEGVLASVDGMKAAMKLQRGDIFLNWTPLYHDMGLINNFMLCMIHRIPLAMIETMEFLKRPALWLRALALTGSTITWSPNFGYALAAQRITDAELKDVRLDHVRGFWNAAERIHLDTMLSFQKRFERFGVSLDSLKTNFGCAENVGGATFSDPNGRFVSERISTSNLYGRGIAQVVSTGDRSSETVDVVSVGRPFPRMSIEIMSQNGRELPDGNVGEIALDTPSRMCGYLKNSRETKRAIKGNTLRTGDLGYKRGEELFWVGRVKERINLNGKKFDPSDFEHALLQVDGLRKGCFAAFGVDDATLGTQRLVIVSETRNDCQADETDILRSVKAAITEQVGATVDELVLLPQGTMSKTSSGKRRHRFYRQEYLDGNLPRLTGSRIHTA